MGWGAFSIFISKNMVNLLFGFCKYFGYFVGISCLSFIDVVHYVCDD